MPAEGSRAPVATVSGQPPELATTVERVERIADEVVELWLVDASGGELPAWEPGAHIDVLIAPGLERQYSLCGDPADRRRWRIAVLREPDGRGGSEFMHTRVAAGDELRVRGPRNEFPLAPAEGYLLIAGGIGITPLMAMARELASADADWELVYGGRRRASMAFREELSRYGDRLTEWPEDERGLIELDALLGEPRPGVAVYACGPEPLIEAVEQRCTAWPPGSLHVERFHPRPGALDGARSAFEVVLDASDETIAVAADQSIVEALEAAGYEVPTSCREGTCGTCETVVLDGVPDHRDSVLTPEERADGETMMICCSRALTPRLVLDL